MVSGSDETSGSESGGDEQSRSHRDSKGNAPADQQQTGPGPAQQRSFLVECLTDTAKIKRRLPYILNLLEAEEKPVRVLAATTCCLVAVEADDEELVEYLIRRLSDRLSENEVSLELTTTLDYLSSEYSEYVGTLLEAMATESESQDVPLPEVGNFTRNYYYGYEQDHDGVGRMRIAGKGVDDNPRHTVADKQKEERQKVEYERQREPGDEDDEDEATAESQKSGTDDEVPWHLESEIRRTTDVSSIAVRSRFDELHIQGRRRSGRFATTYEALVGQGGNQQAVALRLVKRPEQTGDRAVFEAEIESHLERWKSVGDHDHLVTLLDWGAQPSPWLATSLARERLADRERTDFVTALGNALNLVEALSYIHQNDVVHGGLDSKNVLFPGDTFEEVDERAPLLDNVGLMQVFRHHFHPAECLDPRYAAPEYYTNRFGRIDHATDIYQLGAIFYRLFTGQPPHGGDFDSIRGSILSSNPTWPSNVVDDVPVEIDNLVSKAMAKQKLRRYETVEHLQQELASIAEEYEYV